MSVHLSDLCISLIKTSIDGVASTIYENKHCNKHTAFVAPASRSTSYQFQRLKVSTLIVKPKQMCVRNVRQAMWCMGHAGQLSSQLNTEVY